MMGKIISLWIIGFSLMLNSCRSTKPSTIFYFDYEGHAAKIISMNKPGKKEHPYNILEVDDMRLKAVDYQQDRTIDVVKVGTIDIVSAQRIYENGLQLAFNSGKLSEKLRSRFTYDYKEGGTFYRIISFRPPGENPYNKFTVVLPGVWEINAIDTEADGTIDTILVNSHPPKSIEMIQHHYNDILMNGLGERKIEKLNGTYHVKLY